jgi:hypothetical protein
VSLFAPDPIPFVLDRVEDGDLPDSGIWFFYLEISLPGETKGQQIVFSVPVTKGEKPKETWTLQPRSDDMASARVLSAFARPAPNLTEEDLAFLQPTG